MYNPVFILLTWEGTGEGGNNDLCLGFVNLHKKSSSTVWNAFQIAEMLFDICFLSSGMTEEQGVLRQVESLE